MPRVLLVDDDPVVYDAITPYARRERWDLRWARSVGEATQAIEGAPPDVVLLDRGLPGVAGDALAARLSKLGAPFLMLTALTDEPDRLSGFDLGADDYVVKPFSVPELVRRVHVVLRRRGSPRIRLPGGVELDSEARLVRVAGRTVSLTATEYALFERMARSPDRVYSREELASLCDLDLDTSDRVIDSHVKNIRKKLRGAGSMHPAIETVVGVGYVVREER
ncbi:response regulator transcription factor [bacterium]|nr:MAG: response regulator transcription factor [bacterium]